MDKEVVVQIHNEILLSHSKEHIWVRYADDTIVMEESEEQKSLLMKVKEESEKMA